MVLTGFLITTNWLESSWLIAQNTHILVHQLKAETNIISYFARLNWNTDYMCIKVENFILSQEIAFRLIHFTSFLCKSFSYLTYFKLSRHSLFRISNQNDKFQKRKNSISTFVDDRMTSIHSA